MDLILYVVDGYNRGQAFDLPRGSCALIGRAEGMNVRLLHESVSRRHARIDHGDTGIQLVDLDSHNGCHVNGIPCLRAELHPGDRVRIGEIELQLVAGQPQTEASSNRPYQPTPRQFKIWGDSPPMRALLESLERAARAERPVLIRGEPGSGKRLVARALHALSPQRRGPFETFACASLAPAQHEAELAGHEPDAGRGTIARRHGLFEHASGGSLFLDEVGALSTGAQARLLQFLETGSITRLGGSEAQPVRCQIIAATQRDLESCARQGSFRADLLYRLGGIELQVPPLQARGADVELLAARFLMRCSREFGKTLHFHKDVWPALHARPWPGNVRELRNCIERAAILAAQPELRARDLR